VKHEIHIRRSDMKKLLVIAALGLAASLANAPAFAYDQQRTGENADSALAWAAAGGHGGLHAAHAEVGTKPVALRRYRGAFDSVDPPSASGGREFVYGPGRAPYPSRGGTTLDFQLEGR
jgi:hypothetical protein